MDAAVQEAKLLRQVNALIVAHLRDHNLTQAAAAVAAATMTPLAPPEPDGDDSVPANQLLRLVAKVCYHFLLAPHVLLPSGGRGSCSAAQRNPA
jgi:hypothetical protein